MAKEKRYRTLRCDHCRKRKTVVETLPNVWKCINGCLKEFVARNIR